MQENNLPNSRFGFIVSKKIDKRAVVRNHLKRKVRSCVESQFLLGNKNKDVLFVIKQGTKDATRDMLCEEMKIFYET